MRRIVVCLLLVLTAWGAAGAAAQDESPEALYKAVEGYPAEQRAEMRAQGKIPTRDDMENIERGQKELASRSAAKLASRTGLKGLDLFYLGALYNYAEKKKEALEAMRLFLADKEAAKGTAAQLARNVVVVYGAQNKMLEEAEAARLAYLANEPKTPGQLLRNEYELGLGYLKAKQFDRAAERAAEAFKLAKELGRREPRREQMIFNAGALLAEAYSGLKKKDESLATVVELFQLALEMPSASLYRMTVSRFRDKADEAERAIVARASERRASPPELTAADWLGDDPLTLEDLRGKVVLIDFWYEWCGPCLRAFPTLRDLQRRYGEKGFTVIGLTDLNGTLGGSGKSREEKLEFLRRFRAGNKLSYPIAVAESGADNLSKYGVSAFPTAVLIDRRGAVRFISVGVSEAEAMRLTEMVEKLVKEPAQ